MGVEVIERLAASPVEYRGQRVITLAQMDAAHDRPEGTAKRAFNKHKDKLIEGEDYYVAIPEGGWDVKRPSLEVQFQRIARPPPCLKRGRLGQRNPSRPLERTRRL